MGRARYRISAKDLWEVFNYVDDRLADAAWVFSLPEDHPAKAAHGKELEAAWRAFKDEYRGDIYAVGDEKLKANREDCAEALTLFLETWFLSPEWRKLKQVLRKRKSQSQKKGRDYKIQVSDDLHWKLSQMVKFDDDCQTFDQLLQKHMAPLYEQMETKHTERLRKDGLRIVAGLPAADRAGLYLFWKKEVLGSGSEPSDPERHAEILADFYARSVEDWPKHRDQYEVERGKYIGLAKRRWPELKGGA